MTHKIAFKKAHTWVHVSTELSFWPYLLVGYRGNVAACNIKGLYEMRTQICFFGVWARPSGSAFNIQPVSKSHTEGRPFAISPQIVFSKLGLVWVLAICRAGILGGDADCAWGWLGGNCRLRLQHDSAGILKSVDDSQSSPNRGGAGAAEFQVHL